MDLLGRIARRLESEPGAAATVMRPYFPVQSWLSGVGGSDLVCPWEAAWASDSAADLRSTAFRYLLQHGVPGPTWGEREFLPTARRPGRTRQGGASPQLLVGLGVRISSSAPGTHP